MSMKLRTYQKTIVIAALEHLAERKSVLIVSPTGSGKTIMAAKIARNFERTLFVSHRKELMDQLAASAERFGVKSYQSVMIQSAHKVVGNFDLIIIDEAHHTMANSYIKLISRFPDALLVGMTATPMRLDGKPLSKLFNAIVDKFKTPDLQSLGYLVKAAHFSVGKSLNLSEIKQSHGDYAVSELAKKIREFVVFGDVIQEYKKHAKNRKALVYCVDVSHSREMAQAFNDAGIAAAHVDGATKEAERERALADLESGKIKIVTNCQLFTEGVDVPDVSCIIMVRPTLSECLYLQMAGRGLRMAPGKTNCVIIDHVNNYDVHGDVNGSRTFDYATQEKAVSGHVGNKALSRILTKMIVVDMELVNVNRPTPFFSSFLGGGI